MKMNIINESLRIKSATEVVNKQNADTNEKIRQALSSTKRGKPDNAELLDELGITYRKLDGATGWILTGPNGREISWQNPTSKTGGRLAGVHNPARVNRWTGEQKLRQEIDYLTALTSPDVKKANNHSWNSSEPYSTTSDSRRKQAQVLGSDAEELERSLWEKKNAEQNGSAYITINGKYIDVKAHDIDKVLNELEKAQANLHKLRESKKANIIDREKKLDSKYQSLAKKYNAKKHNTKYSREITESLKADLAKIKTKGAK